MVPILLRRSRLLTHPLARCHEPFLALSGKNAAPFSARLTSSIASSLVGGLRPLTAAALAPLTVPATPAAPLARSKVVVIEEMLAQVRAGTEEPFFVVDVGAALDKLALWRRLLPDVEPFYAVKCCPDPQLIYALAQEGVNFDCASRAEMEICLQLGVSADRIIYANPCKQPSHMRYAAMQGVNLSVVDSVEEIEKTAAIHSKSDVLLRIAVDDSQSQCVMSCKYGAPLSDALELIRSAKRAGVSLRGVSFHVGSGCFSEEAYIDAVDRAAQVFAIAASEGVRMDVLDIGGGFPGSDSVGLCFATIAAALRPALDRHFPPSRGVRLIAEPGRFFAEETHSLAVSIIGKKGSQLISSPEASGAMPMYFINDGLYGSFNCVLYDHAHPQCEPLCTPDGDCLVDRPLTPEACSVWGPTCDGLDCVIKEGALPNLPVGSWLLFDKMGAYTAAAGSNFNGMPLPDKVYLHPTLHP